MNRVFGAIVLFLLSVMNCYSNDTLYLEQYLKVVAENHPLIKRANINDDIAAAQILKGQGTLDPKIYSAYDAKQFDDTDYFTVWQSEAKIPTTLPIDFSVGYERNDGVFLNEQNSVPQNGLVYGTINISLLRGFLFDEQRYNIQAAELKGLKSQIEREIIVREIFFQAISTYLDWTSVSNTVDLNEQFLELLNERHQNVIQLFLNGDSPAVDTIESRVNLNSVQKILLESRNKLVKAKQNLSLFIWDVNGQPLTLNSGITSMQLDRLIDALKELSILITPDFNADPLIAKIDNDTRLIELDTKLERENLKPQLDLKYNTILNLGKEEFKPTFSLNDYKYGVTFQYPLRNRKTKGQLRINEALADQNELDKLEYLGRLNNKFIGLLSQEVIQDDILSVANEKLINSQLLYEAEVLKFGLGESSVFLLNSRERKLLEAQTELIKSYYTLGLTLSELYYLKMGQI
jgi:outer membrane protein TolC